MKILDWIRIAKISDLFNTTENGSMVGALPSLPFQKGTTGAEVLYHNSIIGNIMLYQDLLETNLLQVFGHPENSE